MGCEFWLNWIVNLGIAVGTIGAVIISLFGEKIKYIIFPTKINIKLKNSTGERNTARIGSGKEYSLHSARYYHIRVSNYTRWSPAHNVNLYLLSLERMGPSLDFQEVWSGEVPFRWRNHEYYAGQRTVGHGFDADLISAIQGVGVSLSLLIIPFNIQYLFEEKFRIRIKVQAKSTEADSNIMHLEISWDGMWHDGEAEMAKSLIIKEVAS